jgi:tRNA(fMet)-specific endonuclease VapC
MNNALLDTDIYSDILRAVNATVIANARTYRRSYGRLTLSVITVMEMVKGFQQVQRPQKINDLLTHVGSEDVLELDQPAAELAGRIWGDLERTGQPIGLDGQVMGEQGWRSDRATVLGLPLCGAVKKIGRFFSSGFTASPDA